MRYIDQDEIYRLTEQGKAIFEYYFPGEELGNPKKFIKQRTDEKTPSARVTMYGGYWRITDFGKQDQVNGMKAIDFVMYREVLPYYDALQWIEQVVIKRTVDSGNFQKSKWQAEYSMREMLPADKKGDYNFTYKDHPTSSDLEAIGRYVSESDLDYFNCKTVDKYEFCGISKSKNKDVVHIFTATKDYPIFVFDYGDFKKIYKPHEQDKKFRFLYVGTKPKNYIYGLAQIKKIPNEFTINPSEEDKEEGIKLPEGKPNARVIDLFRVSGESDALNMHSLGFNVYWLNSETAEFSRGEYKEVDDFCENHYQVMDLDPTGKDQLHKNALKHINLYSVELPEWLRIKKDFRGNPCKDLKDFINLSGSWEDDTKHNLTVLKKNARRVKFWSKFIDKATKKASYAFNMEDFYFFLMLMGFYQMESIYHKKAGYCYVRVRGKVVDLIHPDDIKRLVKRVTKEWIRSKNLMDGKEILNKINTSNQITEANMESIDEISINFKNYDRFTEYIHFRNGSLKITKDKIERVKNEDIPNYILGFLEVNQKNISHIIDRDIRLQEKPAIEINATPEYQSLLDALAAAATDEEREAINIQIAQMADIDKYDAVFNDDKFVYVQFLKDISRLHWRKEIEKKVELTPAEQKEQTLSLANLMFIIGYHCAQYKDQGKAWLTFLQDMRVSEIGKSSGGSGKSLLSKAPTYVRTSFYKGGRSLNDKNQYQFFYDGMTEFHDFIEIDDMHEHADINFFYTQVTGKREINPKNYAAFTLDYENSGKMLISSNYELLNMDDSTIRRLLNGGTSDYYHEKTKFNDYKESRSPLTKFGRRLYDDFTEEEWVKFYNLVAYCIQLQMRFHKIQPPMMNLEMRQLRREMAKGLGSDEEFLKWARDYFVIAPELHDITQESPPDQGYFNRFVIKKVAYDNFCESCLTKDQSMRYKIEKFKKHIQAFCEYNEYELNPIQYQTDNANQRIMRKVDGKLVEVFLISTKKLTAEMDGNADMPPFAIEPDNEMPF